MRTRLAALTMVCGYVFVATRWSEVRGADPAPSKTAVGEPSRSASAGTAASVDRETVARLVRALDGAELAAREEAEKELMALGPAVLDLLPEPTRKTSAEVRQRLARVKQALERLRARSFTEGTMAALDGSATTLDEALESLSKQTGNALIDYREEFGQEVDDRTVELKSESKAFWQVLDEVLDAASMTVYPFAQEPGLALVARTPNQSLRVGKACYRGAFRIEPTNLNLQRDLRDASASFLVLRLEVAWEPRVKPIGLKVPMATIAGADEQGGEVRASDTEAEIEALMTPGVSAVEVELPLALPPRTAQRVAELRGTVEVLTPGGMEIFRFDHLERAGERELVQGGAHVTLDEVRKNNDLWEIRVRVRYDEASGALESHRDWVFENEAYLETVDGRRLAHDGYQTTLQNEEEVGVAYLFDLPKGPADLTFVYKTPSVVLEVPVEFELKGLELP